MTGKVQSSAEKRQTKIKASSTKMNAREGGALLW